MRRLFGTAWVMKSRRRILLAFWLLVQLLAGQQLALAHRVGHVGESLHDHSAQVHAADGDEERGAAHSLSHACTICIGCIGFDAIAVTGFLALPAHLARVPELAVAVPPTPTFDQPLAFLSRAPPLLRN